MLCPRAASPSKIILIWEVTNLCVLASHSFFYWQALLPKLLHKFVTFQINVIAEGGARGDNIFQFDNFCMQFRCFCRHLLKLQAKTVKFHPKIIELEDIIPASGCYALGNNWPISVYLYSAYSLTPFLLQESTSSSKVAAKEIVQKFQKEIEKANKDKAKVLEFNEKKKANRRSASSDSLLSMDENSDCSSSIKGPTILPPKGHFMSTENLALPAPKRPPKATNLNKRVSISTNAVHIIDNHYVSDGSVKERIKTFMDPTKASKKAVFDKDGKKIDDLPEDLPSVRNLASMFNPRKSPEPLPRNSLNNKVSPLFLIFFYGCSQNPAFSYFFSTTQFFAYFLTFY